MVCSKITHRKGIGGCNRHEKDRGERKKWTVVGRLINGILFCCCLYMDDVVIWKSDMILIDHYKMFLSDTHVVCELGQCSWLLPTYVFYTRMAHETYRPTTWREITESVFCINYNENLGFKYINFLILLY